MSLLYAPRTGETFSGIHDRADAFIRLLIDYMNDEYPNVKRVMLVSHAATVIALGRAIVGDRRMAIRAGTCSLSRYDRIENEEDEDEDEKKKASGTTGTSENGSWKCTLNGWTGHLAKGEQVSSRP